MSTITLKHVDSVGEADMIWQLFLVPNITGVLSEGEKLRFKENIHATLNKGNSRFFYLEDESGTAIGAVGVWENYIANGGYIIEHYAVRDEHRGKGYGKQLFAAAENFAIERKARYICMETGDDPFYESGRKIYEKFGYKQVSHFPEYYDKSSGRIDYMKMLNK